MCGRLATLFTWAELRRLMTLLTPEKELPPHYNVAPGQWTPVIRQQPDGTHCASLLRWGLIPLWAEDPKIGYKMINARCESLLEKPSYRDAFKQQRCLVPASGFYEWAVNSSGKGKVPYYFRSVENHPLLLAGLWESWKSPSKTASGGEIIESFTIITTNANDLMRPIHERMPVVLSLQSATLWLHPQATAAQLMALLSPCDNGTLTTIRVSKAVNSPSHDGPECLEAVGKAV